MNLKTYRAYSMADALTAVKRDLGPDAVILNTRSTKKGGFLGIGKATIVEVVAMPADEAAKVKPKPRQRPVNSAPAMKAYSGASRQQRAHDPAHDDDQFEIVSEEDQRRTREFARTMLERLEKQKASEQATSQRIRPVAPAPPAEAHREARQPSSAAPQQSTKHDAQPETTPSNVPPPDATAADAAPLTQPAAAAQRFVLQRSADADTQHAASSNAPAQVELKPQQPAFKPSADGAVDDAHRSANRSSADDGKPDETRAAAAADPQFEQMQSELSAIRQMVGHVLQRSQTPGGASPTMPKQLFDYYLKLVAQDLSDELADQIVNAVRDELKSMDMSDTDRLREAVLEQLTDYIPCADDPLPTDLPTDRPLTIALVGPTGVGKTTTLAKLAASFKLRHDRKVGLVTCDTYRIAAVDQLRTYANIIGLSLEVVLTPAEMNRALDRLQDCDVILIDTAGRSQRDAQRIDELKQFMDAANPHEVHLVLSSTASEKVLLQEAEAFSSVGVDKLVFTKLDEAVSFGMLINVTRELGKQLSFFTTGQEVPDHLEIGRPGRLAELVLGGAVHA